MDAKRSAADTNLNAPWTNVLMNWEGHVIPRSTSTARVGPMSDTCGSDRADGGVQSAGDSPTSDSPPQVAVVGTTFAGIVTLWSAGAERMFGWTQPEALGRPIAELAGWALTDSDFAEFVFVGASGVWIREHEARTRSGRRLALKTTASLVVGENGVDEVIASIVPIGEAGEDAPELLHDRPFRAIVERGSDLVVICDRDMVINYVGPSLGKIFGYLPRQVIGVLGWRLVHPDDLTRLSEQWESVLASPGEHRELELRIRDSSGVWHWVQLRISNLVADLAISAMVLNLRDVTEQRSLGDKLEVTERLMQSILEAAVEGVIVADVAGQTILTNARMAELLAVDLARLASGSALELVDEATQVLVRQRMSHRAAGVREQYEFPFVRLDGVPRWLRVSSVPRYDQDGHYIGSTSMCTDITDRKLLEERLEQLSGAGRDPAPAGELAGSRSDTDSYIAGRVAEYLRAAAAEVPAGSGSNPEGPVPGLDRLSRREIEVVRMLLLGDRVPVIAQHLFVSQSTVRNHLSSVFRKVRVSSQQELIVLLRERSPGGWSAIATDGGR